jgi:hypothetical protein
MSIRKDVDDFWNIIQYNYDQIRYAEVKSSVVLSVYSLFFTAAYTLDILDEENIYDFSMDSIWDYICLIFLIPGLYFAIVSITSCIRCFLPRLKQSALKSPLFFGDIATDNENFEEYHKKLKKIRDDDPEYHKHLSHMAYVTGNIAFTKFRHVNQGIKSLIKSILLLITYIIGLYTINLL